MAEEITGYYKKSISVKAGDLDDGLITAKITITKPDEAANMILIDEIGILFLIKQLTDVLLEKHQKY